MGLQKDKNKNFLDLCGDWLKSVGKTVNWIQLLLWKGTVARVML